MRKMKTQSEASGVMDKVKRVQRSLDALEICSHAEFDIHQCCDYIAWIQKWHKVSDDIWIPMCEQATRILQLTR